MNEITIVVTVINGSEQRSMALKGTTALDGPKGDKSTLDAVAAHVKLGLETFLNHKVLRGLKWSR